MRKRTWYLKKYFIKVMLFRSSEEWILNDEMIEGQDLSYNRILDNLILELKFQLTWIYPR